MELLASSKLRVRVHAGLSCSFANFGTNPGTLTYTATHALTRNIRTHLVCDIGCVQHEAKKWVRRVSPPVQISPMYPKCCPNILQLIEVPAPRSRCGL